MQQFISRGVFAATLIMSTCLVHAVDVVFKEHERDEREVAFQAITSSKLDINFNAFELEIKRPGSVIETETLPEFVVSVHQTGSKTQWITTIVVAKSYIIQFIDVVVKHSLRVVHEPYSSVRILLKGTQQRRAFTGATSEFDVKDRFPSPSCPRDEEGKEPDINLQSTRAPGSDDGHSETTTEGISEQGSNAPTASPTNAPTANPTASPTANPTASPTKSPTANPTQSPTDSPTTSPTASPTAARTASSPSNTPTKADRDSFVPNPLLLVAVIVGALLIVGSLCGICVVRYQTKQGKATCNEENEENGLGVSSKGGAEPIAVEDDVERCEAHDSDKEQAEIHGNEEDEEDEKTNVDGIC